MKIQNGGIIIKDKDPEKAFHYFIQNRSYLSVISKTPTSVLLECSLNRDVLQNSPYLMLRPENYKRPVNCILLKLGLVVTNIKNINGNQLNYINNFINFYFKMKETNKNFKNYNISGTKQNFIDEINIQTDVFLKTIDYLDPLCPGVVYGNVIDDMNDSIKFISDLQERCSVTTNEVLTELRKVFVYLLELCNNKSGTNKIIQDSIVNIRGNKSPSQLTEQDIKNLELIYYISHILILDESSTFNIGLGIIAMEFVDHNYKTFANLYYDIRTYDSYKNNPLYKEQVNTYENMARLKLIELALKTGYSQGDFHPGNIMIEQTLQGYYQGYKGRVMLIDFGYAKKIPLDKLAEIKVSYKNHDYMNCIKILFDLGRMDADSTIIFLQYLDLFGWIPHVYDNIIKQRIENTSEILKILNEQIENLNIAQEKAIDDRVLVFDSLHKSDGIYPLLPLSNEIKNSLFEGMIKLGGRRRKNKKKRTYRKARKLKTYKKSGRSRQSKQKMKSCEIVK